MNPILVLTANPALPEIAGPTIAGPAIDTNALEAAIGIERATRVLAPGIAVEIYPKPDDPARILQRARAALGHAPIDANLVSAERRRKRLLVADMESTLIENEMLDDIAELLGIGAHVAEITRRAMNGELDFRAALLERVGLLAGKPAALLARAATGIRVVPGAKTLAATMRANGARTAIVSGGFTYFTALVRERLGFEQDFANRLDMAGDTLAGTVAEPILGREAKRATLEKLAGEIGAPLDATLTVGDGANDLAMLDAAGFGVAFRAKPAVAAQARLNIRHGDLTALLYLQGYAREEFVG